MLRLAFEAAKRTIPFLWKHKLKAGTLGFAAHEYATDGKATKSALTGGGKYAFNLASQKAADTIAFGLRTMGVSKENAQQYAEDFAPLVTATGGGLVALTVANQFLPSSVVNFVALAAVGIAIYKYRNEIGDALQLNKTTPAPDLVPALP